MGMQDVHEESDLPFVCDSCLGPNSYVRLLKFTHGSKCHLTGKAFTVYRWKASFDSRYKKTVICKEIAISSNICQVCLLDINIGVPVGVLKALKIKEVASTKNFIDGFKKNVIRRNDVRICSFFLSGSCSRGSLCPYRHEIPSDNYFIKQEYSSRFLGNNDPVSLRNLNKIASFETKKSIYESHHIFISGDLGECAHS